MNPNHAAILAAYTARFGRTPEHFMRRDCLIIYTPDKLTEDDDTWLCELAEENTGLSVQGGYINGRHFVTYSA